MDTALKKSRTFMTAGSHTLYMGRRPSTKCTGTNPTPVCFSSRGQTAASANSAATHGSQIRAGLYNRQIRILGDQVAKCPKCGAEIDDSIPEKTRHEAERWRHHLEVEARRKKDARKQDPNYCRSKKAKNNE